jgi:outer membrane protein assembly factor BamB
VKIVDGRPQLVSIGSRAVISYDASTGAEIWKLRHAEYNATAKPLFHQDLAILHTGSRTAHLIGLKLDRTTVGDVTETHVKWDRPRGNNGIPFPVLHQGRVFTLTDTGVALCVDASSGEEIWTDRIGGTCIASPIVLNGLIYYCTVEGVTHVCRAGDKFEIVAKNKLAEGMRASPAVAEGSLYLRTHGHLYKIASP